MNFDLVVRGGSVVDGSGTRPPYPADVGLTGGRIVAVGDLGGAGAESDLDATGLIVAPGFIDAHTHTERSILAGPEPLAGVLQGVTTILTAPDGFGWAPVTESEVRSLWRSTAFCFGDGDDPAIGWPTVHSYLSEFTGRTPQNVAPLAPHLAIRYGAMGWRDGRPDTTEWATMRAALAEWLGEGAFGLAAGLDYQPSSLSDTNELVELARIVAETRGVFAAHLRYLQAGSEGSWRELIEIGRRSGIPITASHELVNDTVAGLLDEAAGDTEVAFDSYLYPAGSTHLLYNLPVELQVGGPDGVLDRLSEMSYRERASAALVDAFETAEDQGQRIEFNSTRTGRYIGETPFEAAKRLDMGRRVFMEMVLREELPDALLLFHHGTPPREYEEIVRRTIAHPRMYVASDGVPVGIRPHPRLAGCFARILRWCVRELDAVPVEMAVHKMSGFPAAHYRIPDRGRIVAGAAGDLVVFDLATVSDRSTWLEPRLAPTGIRAVFVNGQLVVDDGEPTGVLPGRVLARA